MSLFALVVLAKGLIWTVVLPPWYGPDEPEHFNYVQSLAGGHGIPALAGSRADGRDVPAEVACSEASVGFSLNGPFFPQPLWPHPVLACPASGTPRTPEFNTNPAAAYSPFYYALAVPFWEAAAAADVETRLHAVRLLSVLLGVVAAVATLLAARAVFAGRAGPTVAAGFIFAFQPIASQQFAVANNDALLVALAAIFTWLACRAWAGGWRPATAAVLGAVTGAAYVAKPQGAALAAVAAVFLLGQLIRRRDRAAVIGAGAVYAGAALAVALTWIGLESFGAAGPFAQAAYGGGHGRLHDYVGAYLANDLARTTWILLVSPWGHFGWVAVAMPWAAFVAIAAVELLAFVGLALALARRRLEAEAGLAAMGVAVIVLLLFASEALLFRAHGEFVLQGRSFLPALPMLAIAITAGLRGLVRSARRPAVDSSLVVGAVTLNLVAVAVMVGTWYR